MTNSFHYCNHCGCAVEDGLNGYTGVELTDFSDMDDIDLCSPCFQKLKSHIKVFIGDTNENDQDIYTLDGRLNK